VERLDSKKKGRSPSDLHLTLVDADDLVERFGAQIRPCNSFGDGGAALYQPPQVLTVEEKDPSLRSG
jgi:hypothetical protein